MLLITEGLAQRLVLRLGEDFLRYVLALPPDGDIMVLLQQVSEPEPVVHLIGVLNQAPPGATEELDVTLFAIGIFGQYRPDLGTTLAQHIRAICGKPPEVIPTGEDEVVQTLRLLAKDVWPTLLLKAPATGPRGFWMTSMGSLLSNPGTLPAVKAFMSDEALASLFPESTSVASLETMGEEVLGIASNWILSTGRFGTRQLLQVLDSIVFHAAVTAQLEGHSLNHDVVMKSIETSVGTFRRLALGERVELPAVVGLNGPVVPLDKRVVLGNSYLRAPLAVERNLLLSEPDRVTAVLESTYSVQILKVLPVEDDGDQFFKESQKFSTRVEESLRGLRRRTDQVRFSILLASPNARDPLAASVVSQFVADPTQVGGSPSWEEDTRRRATYVIDDELMSNVASWHDGLQQNHPESLNIARKRLLSAVSERWDAVDAFIDAVVVWENAFGASQETTFRVTASIAKLLEPGRVEARISLQAELKKLYAARSQLVHGAKEPDEAAAWAQRERSIEIAVLVLRALYEDRRDLLQLSSDARGAQLLLEG